MVGNPCKFRLLHREESSQVYGVTERRVQQLIKMHRETGRSVPNSRKQQKRKRCRYEREHSGSLVHGDWHRTTENHPNAISWLEYDRHRWRFDSLEAFLTWYNNRILSAIRGVLELFELLAFSYNAAGYYGNAKFILNLERMER